MTLLTYLGHLTADQRRVFADELRISLASLSQYANGHRRISAGLAIEIERLTRGVLRCEDLHPHADWSFVRGSGGRRPPPAKRSARRRARA